MKKELLEQISSEHSKHRQFIETSFPSIYSREDVLKIVDEFAHDASAAIEAMEETEAGATLGLTYNQKEDLKQMIREKMQRKLDRMDSEDVIDYDSAEFEVQYGNTLRLESINFNADTIADEMDYAVDEAITDFFEPIEEVNETPYATEQ